MNSQDVIFNIVYAVTSVITFICSIFLIIKTKERGYVEVGVLGIFISFTPIPLFILGVLISLFITASPIWLLTILISKIKNIE